MGGVEVAFKGFRLLELGLRFGASGAEGFRVPLPSDPRSFQKIA